VLITPITRKADVGFRRFACCSLQIDIVWPHAKRTKTGKANLLANHWPRPRSTSYGHWFPIALREVWLGSWFLTRFLDTTRLHVMVGWFIKTKAE
jgi:hypothetical protein